MSGGVAVIKVGAATERGIERKWNSVINKMPLHDSRSRWRRNRCRGGTALMPTKLFCSRSPWIESDEATIVLRALKNLFAKLPTPMPVTIYCDWSLEMPWSWNRFQCCNRWPGNMIDAGIIDPAKVSSALQTPPRSLVRSDDRSSQQTRTSGSSRTSAMDPSMMGGWKTRGPSSFVAPH